MHALSLYGIIEDGCQPHPDLPWDARQALTVLQGETTSLCLTVRYRSGGFVDLVTGSPTLSLTISDRCGNRVKTFAFTPNPECGRGHATLDLASSAFSSLCTGRYGYSVSLLAGSDKTFLIPLSPLLLQVTQ